MKILVALDTISAAQTSRTIETEKAIQKLLDYCATHPDATLQYKSIIMILKAHSAASYLYESQGRIISGGLLYMVDATNDLSQPNDVIMVISTIIHNVMLSAAEE